MKTLSKWALSAIVLFVGFTPVHAVVIDFGASGGPGFSLFTPYVEDGMTISPIATTPPQTNGQPVHFDIVQAGQGGSAADNAAHVHMGNSGEKVQFVFSGGAFDLLSIGLEFFELDEGRTSLPVTFTASSGATHSTSSLGTINFAALSGWSNISSFTMEVPLGDYNCATPGVDCSGVTFDDVTFQAAIVPPPPGSVPEPFSTALLATGLFLLALTRRRVRA